MRTILLATPDSNDVYTFWLYHKQCGIQNPVEVLSDGNDVIRYLAGVRSNLPPPALLVASFKMPQMGGLKLLEHLMETNQNGFPSVLLLDPEDHKVSLAVTAYRLGLECFLMRPIQKKEFCNVMSRFPTLTLDGCADVGIWMPPKSIPKPEQRTQPG